MRAVLANTEVIADAELNKLYPDKFPARVTITLKDGKSFQETVLFPKGDPQDPLSAAEIEAKFRGNAESAAGRGARGRIAAGDQGLARCAQRRAPDALLHA